MFLVNRVIRWAPISNASTKQEAKIERSDEPDDDEIEEPQVRPSKKATEEAPKEKKAAADIVDEWLAE